MKGEDGLYRRLDQAADTRFLQRCRRIGGVVTDRDYVIARSQREDSVGDARQQADHAMRMIGHRDFASAFVRQDAACMSRENPAGPGHQHEDKQRAPHAVAASCGLASAWPLRTNGRPATSRSTLDATRATLWFSSPSRSRKRRPEG